MSEGLFSSSIYVKLMLLLSEIQNSSVAEHQDFSRRELADHLAFKKAVIYWLDESAAESIETRCLFV